MQRTTLHKLVAKMEMVTKRDFANVFFTRHVDKEKVEKLFLDWYRGNIRAGGRPEKWKPLAPSTLRRKKGSIMYESGDLFTSIYVEVLRTATIKAGIKAPYSRWHHSGTKRMPARKTITTSPQLLMKYRQELLAAFKRAWTKGAR